MRDLLGGGHCVDEAVDGVDQVLVVGVVVGFGVRHRTVVEPGGSAEGGCGRVVGCGVVSWRSEREPVVVLFVAGAGPEVGDVEGDSFPAPAVVAEDLVSGVSLSLNDDPRFL